MGINNVNKMLFLIYFSVRESYFIKMTCSDVIVIIKLILGKIYFLQIYVYILRLLFDIIYNLI